MKFPLFICHIFSIAIFKGRQSLGARKRPYMARDIFSDSKPSAPKLFLTCDNRSKFVYSYVTYFLLPCFRKDKLHKRAGIQPWPEMLLLISHLPQRYLRPLAICQNILIHTSNISYVLDGKKTLRVLIEKL